MKLRSTALLVAALSLIGCSNRAAMIVDLAGGLVVVFLILIALEYIAPAVSKSSFFLQFIGALRRHIGVVVVLLYIIAAILIGFGASLSGLHKILLLCGIVICIVAFYLKRYVKESQRGQGRRSLDIVLLGLSVLGVLAVLWIMGPSLFDAF